MEYKEENMILAIEEAKRTMREGKGGPFGAMVIDEKGEILSIASNTVLEDHNPTAHGEINAIIKACQKKQTHDLTGCTLYTTAYPCPMCLAAIIWANIKKIYYGCKATDAAEIGFRDDYIYDFIKDNCENKNVLDLEMKSREECLELMKEYQKDKKEIY